MTKRGRTPLPDDVAKREAIGFRATTAMRRRLEAEATRSGRSISREIEIRLEQSFLLDGILNYRQRQAQ
jgi:hypothetical protein